MISDSPALRIGALAPLTSPGWVDAGWHLVAGLTLAVEHINEAGGVGGKPVELIVRDTAASPERAAAAVDELARLGVVAVGGEYHSVAARAAAARADALGLPFLCSSAVLDALTESQTDWVARLAPAQSHGWRIYADFLLGQGHRHLVVATEPSVYWAAGVGILRDCFASHGGTVSEFDARSTNPETFCARLIEHGATGLILLVGNALIAGSIIASIRQDQRIGEVLFGAPAGQPEFIDWATALGVNNAAIPFLSYMPERVSPLGMRVDQVLRDRLGKGASFVAFEGYDTILVLADLLRSRRADAERPGAFWSGLVVEGTRGLIQFSRLPGKSVWQWAGAPVQVVDRNPAEPARLRVLG